MNEVTKPATETERLSSLMAKINASKLISLIEHHAYKTLATKEKAVITPIQPWAIT